MDRASEATRPRHVALFLALAFGFSWAFWVPEALQAQGVIGDWPELPALGAFGPSLAAFVMVLVAHGPRGAGRLAKRAIDVRVPRRWIAVALLLGPAIVAVSLAVAYATGSAPDYPWAGQPWILPIAFVFILLLGGPLQEEFGWRGYLLDPVQVRLGALGGGIAVGVVWALWHVPLFFIPSETNYYDSPFLGFAVSITLLSVLMTWVYNHAGGSLLPMLLMHTSWNWSQGMFPVLGSDAASLTMVLLLALVTLGVVLREGPRRLVRVQDAPR